MTLADAPPIGPQPAAQQEFLAVEIGKARPVEHTRSARSLPRTALPSCRRRPPGIRRRTFQFECSHGELVAAHEKSALDSSLVGTFIDVDQLVAAEVCVPR